MWYVSGAGGNSCDLECVYPGGDPVTAGPRDAVRNGEDINKGAVTQELHSCPEALVLGRGASHAGVQRGGEWEEEASSPAISSLNSLRTTENPPAATPARLNHTLCPHKQTGGAAHKLKILPFVGPGQGRGRSQDLGVWLAATGTFPPAKGKLGW
uniref:Uncharacterized protein n=1 Tax=Knipowitschia caucasica TaxID=637954 RepID=A0AAV2K493_KNICA